MLRAGAHPAWEQDCTAPKAAPISGITAQSRGLVEPQSQQRGALAVAPLLPDGQSNTRMMCFAFQAWD